MPLILKISSGALTLPEYFKSDCLLIYSSVWIVNLFALKFLVEQLGFTDEPVQGVVTTVIAICQFVLRKFWVLPEVYIKIFHDHSLQ